MPALPSAHQEYRKGRLAQHEMRDADPELVRARARVLGARRTDVVSPPRPSCAIAKRSGDYAAYVFEVWPGLPVEPPRPHLRPQPRPLSVSPEARPAEPILGTTNIAGSSRRVPWR
jgi:hypothetical protein